MNWKEKLLELFSIIILAFTYLIAYDLGQTRSSTHCTSALGALQEQVQKINRKVYSR